MKVEIWSDIVCPWCYIGKRRFEAALAEFKHRDQVEVVWRSFELDPNAAPPYPGTLEEVIAKKFGFDRAKATAMLANLTELAAKDGLEYKFDHAKRGNTFNAHRLIHLAHAHNLQGVAKERLLYAYFTEGKAIGDVDTLVTLASEIGLDPEEVHAMFASDLYADEVKADVNRANAFGIRGVPFFAIDETYGVSGAQPAEVLLDTLEKAWAASHPLISLDQSVGQVEGRGVCEGDDCEIPLAETSLEGSGKAL